MVSQHVSDSPKSLISSEDAKARRQQALEAEQALLATARIRRRAWEAEKFTTETDVEIRTPHHFGVESAAAERIGRTPLGDTLISETAALLHVLARIAPEAHLVQRAGTLYVVQPDGGHRPVTTVEALRAVVTMACIDDGDFAVPFVRFTVDRKGKRHATDAEPRLQAWRTTLAAGTWPGVPVWSGLDDGQTGQQKAVSLLRQAVEARLAMQTGQRRLEVAAAELAELTGWPRSAIEQLIAEAGYRVTRPLTPDGRPRLDSRTRRVLLSIER